VSGGGDTASPLQFRPLEIELGTTAVLVGAAFVAGTIDAIAGGGGLVTVPALIWAGLPTEIVLGTNKGQSVFGSFAAMMRFGRSGLLDKPRARRTFPAGLLGAAAGAFAVAYGIEHGKATGHGDAMKSVVLALLVGVAVLLLAKPKTLVPKGEKPARPHLWAVVIATLIGAYDGFFGPGTGTFLILAFVVVLKDAAAQASADAKVVNFASNLASMIVFQVAGWIRWEIALPMAAAQFAGGLFGGELTVRGGDALVRRVTPVVLVAVAAKLAYDLLVAS
jgi:uncharacterized membrane protein YfcA